MRYMSEVDKYLEMAESSLKDAKMVKNDSERLFWNSLYYSLFYSARASLISKGFEPKTHSGTDSLIGRELYKKEEIISADEASFYSDMRRIREEVDYEPFTTITKDKDESIQNAESLISKFKEII